MNWVAAGLKRKLTSQSPSSTVEFSVQYRNIFLACSANALYLFKSTKKTSLDFMAKKIKSSTYSTHYAEACNDRRGPSQLFSA